MIFQRVFNSLICNKTNKFKTKANKVDIYLLNKSDFEFLIQWFPKSLMWFEIANAVKMIEDHKM